jgi:hypothetical protein
MAKMKEINIFFPDELKILVKKQIDSILMLKLRISEPNFLD